MKGHRIVGKQVGTRQTRLFVINRVPFVLIAWLVYVSESKINLITVPQARSCYTLLLTHLVTSYITRLYTPCGLQNTHMLAHSHSRLRFCIAGIHIKIAFIKVWRGCSHVFKMLKEMEDGPDGPTDTVNTNRYC